MDRTVWLDQFSYSDIDGLKIDSKQPMQLDLENSCMMTLVRTCHKLSEKFGRFRADTK